MASIGNYTGASIPRDWSMKKRVIKLTLYLIVLELGMGTL